VSGRLAWHCGQRVGRCRYQISILQIELSLTQVLDRPVSGRIFFEDVIRENLDIGRPKQVQLIFDRGVTKTTPGRFRTRVITDGVIPSLHIDYKGTRIKQYHKEGQALRTETAINNTKDFYMEKSLRNNLAALLGQPVEQFTQNRMTYQLRRLRLHGLIERIPKTHRYRMTSFGIRVAVFCTRAYCRILRPGLGLALPATSSFPGSLRRSFDNLEQEVNSWVVRARLAA
jgi:hypothetical protein